MFVTMTKLLQAAEENGYALPRFSICNLETVQATIEAAEELDSPVVLSLFQAFKEGFPPGYMESLVKFAGAHACVPVAFMLDHGKSMEVCRKAIEEGYSAVMIDASLFPYEENVALTRKVVDFAHAAGVAVEGALGVIAKEMVLTDPDQTRDFVEKTEVDALAVSIGEYSGFYKEKPALDFKRLRQIKEQARAYLVLHGASGLSEEDIRRTIECGISHIGFGTDLRDIFFRTIEKKRQDNPGVVDPRQILWPAKDAMREVVKTKMRIVGSVGMARAVEIWKISQR